MLTNLLTWFIFGSVIGSLAYIVEPKLRNLRPIILGIIGAFIAGILTDLLLNISIQQFSLISFLVAMCGASFLVVSMGILQKT